MELEPDAAPHTSRAAFDNSASASQDNSHDDHQLDPDMKREKNALPKRRESHSAFERLPREIIEQ